MPKWTDYTIKTDPADKDEVMILDTAGKANKRLGLSALSDWIIGKIANKVFENLQTQNKTILGALNELNSKPLATESDDLNNVPAGLAIYHWNLQTANTPRTENLTEASSGIVFSYLESEAWAAQFGMIPADKNLYIRTKSITWSNWSKLNSDRLTI